MTKRYINLYYFFLLYLLSVLFGGIQTPVVRTLVYANCLKTK